MKKSKKVDVDVRLFIFKNLKKTFKYYFKNIFYILFINIAGFIIFNNFLKVPYSHFISKFIGIGYPFYVVYYGSLILAFLAIKVILYGNTVYVMHNHGSNDLKELFSLVIKRFLPVLGTFIIYACAVLFFSLLLLIPGIVFFFYYYFGVFLCAVGDINNKEKNKEKILNGAKAIARSYNLVKNNLLRFMALTIIVAFLTYFIQVFLRIFLTNLGIVLSSTAFNIMRFTIFDIFVIYSALLFIKLEGIENDVVEAEFEVDREEQAKLNKAAINNFGKSKK